MNSPKLLMRKFEKQYSDFQDNGRLKCECYLALTTQSQFITVLLSLISFQPLLFQCFPMLLSVTTLVLLVNTRAL